MLAIKTAKITVTARVLDNSNGAYSSHEDEKNAGSMTKTTRQRAVTINKPPAAAVAKNSLYPL